MTTWTDLAAQRARTLRRFLPMNRGDDAGVAMVTVIIAIMLTATLSVLMLGVMVSEMLPTAFLRTSSKTVFGAEAGVNAVVGQIRTAAGAPDVTGAIYGDTTKLPCSASGPVDGAGTALTYTATVQYFLQNPTGKSSAWIAANAISCTPGSGPAHDPSFAQIIATGVGAGVAGMGATTGDRTVSVTYEFKVTNNNIPGGLIYSFDSAITPDRFCLEASAATVGSNVKYVPAVECGTRNALQLWIYDTDYEIKLASTTVPGLGVPPLCITGPVGAVLPQMATLQACKAKTNAARWNQLFSWEGGSRWVGETQSINGYSSIWLSSGTASGSPSGRYLFVGSSAPGDNEWGSFDPDARVGAGAAGSATFQIVNYLEFGRCFDVTDQDVNKSFMIAYPCKQDPSGGTLLNWNHKWFYDEPPSKAGSKGPQQIFVMENNTTKYCLVSPNSDGGYVTLTSGCSTTADNQKWTRVANTGVYDSSYLLVDKWGRCAALGDKYNGAWSKIVTTPCAPGNLAQKWNAPPNAISSALNGYVELP